MDFAQLLCEIMSKPPTHSTADLVKLAEKTGDITEKVIIAMMTENTGMHMLDSGGTHGRAWQRRKLIEDWNALSNISWKGDYMSKSMYHFLIEQLEYDPELDKEFHEFCKSEEMKKESYYACKSTFKDYLEEKYEPDGSYIRSFSDNSYNNGVAIDGTIQYQYVSLQDKDVIILETHNGADVRGGYSTPHVFICSEGIDYFISAQTDMHVECSVCGLTTYTDDAYHWYLDSPYHHAKEWNEFSNEIDAESEDMVYGYQEDKWENAFICPVCGTPFDITGNEHELTLRQRFDGIKKAWIRGTLDSVEKLEKLLLFAGHIDMPLDEDMIQELKEGLKIESKRLTKLHKKNKRKEHWNKFKSFFKKRYWNDKIYVFKKNFNKKHRIWKLSLYDMFGVFQMNEVADKQLLAEWYFLKKKHKLEPVPDKFWAKYNLSEEELCQYQRMSQKVYNWRSFIKLDLILI